MRAGIRKIITLAHNRKVSDRHFRKAIKALANPEVIRKGLLVALEELRKEAETETERDNFVH